MELEYAEVSETNQITFKDTGPVPNSSNYTTVFLLHGMGLNAEVFQKCLPLGQVHNLRLVAVNRPGYSGSSPMMISSDEASWRELSRNLANFLEWFVNEKSIPQFDGQTGGFALYAWSLGAAAALSLCAYEGAISCTEPPHYVVGKVLTPHDGYNPLNDPHIESPEDRQAAFPAWVSSYYDHPDFASHSLKGLNRESPVGRSPTLATIPPDVLGKIMDNAGPMMDAPLLFSSLAVRNEQQTHLALFDELTVSNIFPKVQVWNSVYTTFIVQDQFEELTRAGKRCRPYHFVELEGANHFLMWNEPERFVQVIAESLAVDV
ncbi:Alpha/Beta hydrolase protein [Flagelloscypha sp. PMI_526]|nr:Alpha/Beta hydrolase protein [Flagelloscypha sp. PMI_526]